MVKNTRLLLAIVFVVLIIGSCKSDDEPEIVIRENSSPTAFKLESIEFNGREAEIDWSDSVDEDGDIMYYKLFLNDSLYGEYKQSIANVSLRYNSNYKGKIYVTDKKGGRKEISFEMSSPKSKILLYNNLGNLTALDLLTYEVLWEKQGFYSMWRFPTVIENQVLTGLNGFSAWDLFSGNQVWNSTLGATNQFEVADMISDNSNYYLVDTDSDIYGVDYATREVIWQTSTMDLYAPLTADDNNLYVSTRNNGDLKAFEKETGILKWAFYTDFNDTTASVEINSNPVVDNGNLYFGDNQGRLYCVNTTNGEKNWSIDVGLFNRFGSPTLYRDYIIVCNESSISAYTKFNGERAWTYFTEEGGYYTSYHAPYVNSDKVYIANNSNSNGVVVCLNANDGSVVWKKELETLTNSSPIVYQDKLYITDLDAIYELDKENGSILKRLPSNQERSYYFSLVLIIGNSEEIIYPSLHGAKN